MAERNGLTIRKFDASRVRRGAELLGGSRVDQRRAGGGRAARLPVVEATLGGGGGVVVVGLHQVHERLGPVLDAELVAQLREEVGVARLGAAAVPEDRADERGHGDRVVHRPGRGWRRPCLEGGGDAVGISLEVARGSACPGAVGVHELLPLVRDELLGLGARDERASAGDEPEGVHARNLGHRGASGPAPEEHEQRPVLARRVAGAEPGVLARRPVDVGYAEAVAQDVRPGRPVSTRWSPRSA